MKFLATVATAAVVIFAIAVTLLYSAATDSPLPDAGCWTVTDMTGHVTVFQTAPRYDTNVHAIAFENDGHAGWIFPARVDEDLLCAGNLPTPGAMP